MVATFDRIIFPENYEGMTSVSQSLFDAIGSVEKMDDYTVKFTLSKPRVWQFDLFTMTSAVIYPSDVLEANNNDLRTLVAPGTGPFKFVENKPGELWEFEKNADYWNSELPYVDTVIMQHRSGVDGQGHGGADGQCGLLLERLAGHLGRGREA